MNKFKEVAQERMDFIKAHISAYNVQKEVSELLAMVELMDVLHPSNDVYDVVKNETGYTVSQLSNYVMEMSSWES